MKKYAFILGRNTALSVAEILEVLKREQQEFRIISFSKEVLILEATGIGADFIRGLGGTIKISDVFGEAGKPGDILPAISNYLKTQIKDSAKKYHLGLSIYRLTGGKKTGEKLFRGLKSVYINLKNEFKGEGYKLAFTQIKGRSLNSASVLKNKLIGESGAEICLIAGKNKIFLARTVNVQDVDFYSKIDFGRPVRDVISGTTPPKLAMIMVNLAGKSKDSVFLDPFCGSGTYLQAMKLLGYEKIYGTDKSEKAISDSEKNMDWLAHEFALDISSVNIFQADARELLRKIDGKVDAVVAEGYLGPPLRKEATETEIHEISTELLSLYKKALAEIKKIIAENARIVLALPIFYSKGKKHFLDIEPILDRAGYKIVDLFEGVSGFSEEEVSRRGTFIYSRPDQRVFREILVLEKI